MNFFFWIRAGAAVMVRFVALLAIGIFADNFEVSPFPAWTFTIFLYILLFLTTYLCARWLYGKVLPTHRTLFLALFLFLIVQTIGEALLYIQLTHVSLKIVLNNYSLVSLLLLTWHAFAVFVAYKQKRRHILRSVVPEGMQI